MTHSATIAPPELDELCVNTLRFLAVDMAQKAKSSHPGLPLDSAAMAYAEAALEHSQESVARGSTTQAEWELRLEAYAEEYPDLAAEFQRVMHRQLPKDWHANLPTYTSADDPMATCIASGKGKDDRDRLRSASDAGVA